MTLQQFKTEFRLQCTDPWEDAIAEFYECAGRLELRHSKYPRAWITERGLWPIDFNRPSHFADEFHDSTNEDLVAIGSFLFRYLLKLKRHGLSPREVPQYA